MYEELDGEFEEARLIVAGMSDAGKPIHLFIISKDREFDPEKIQESGKLVILINNGIHPGESNGIDASIEFAWDLLSGTGNTAKYLDNTVILLVPVFNIGGALNRSPFNRANQNGPEEQGFRGNAQNLDLNRDFVKMDSRNARTMAGIIQTWQPDLFIDTHSTNGADYPYTVTLIATHHQQMKEPLSSLIHEKMEPYLYEKMNKSPYKMCHYVNVFRTPPEDGFEGFIETPRYLAGYTAAFNIPSYTVETHMLKPYEERVHSTVYLLGEMLKFSSKHAKKIQEARTIAEAETLADKTQVLNWECDREKPDRIEFTGFKTKTRMSTLTGKDMIYYDQGETWTDTINFYNTFKPVLTVEKPDFYIIPLAWTEVIDRLKISNIRMYSMDKDTSLTVEAYYIENYETLQRPANGHYWHYNTTVRKASMEVKFYKGDLMIPTDQPGAAYLVHVLEPESFDSYFSWNFFDAVLFRNEYFSPYLFESTAAEILEKDPEMREAFEKMKEEQSFRENPYAQLFWIYEHSDWSEPTYMRYPVFRFNGLPIY